MAIVADAVADFTTGVASHIAVVSNDSDFGALFVKIQELASRSGHMEQPLSCGSTWPARADSPTRSGTSFPSSCAGSWPRHRPRAQDRVGTRRRQTRGPSGKPDDHPVAAGRNPPRQVQGRGRPQNRQAPLPAPSRRSVHRRVRDVPRPAADAASCRQGRNGSAPDSEDLRNRRLTDTPTARSEARLWSRSAGRPRRPSLGKRP